MAELPLAYRLVSEFPRRKTPLPNLALQLIGVGFLVLVVVEKLF